MTESKNSTRASARMVGILVLGAFLAYGVGSSITTGIAAAPDYLQGVAGSTIFITGAVMMLFNSAIVFGIGILMLPILKPHNRNVALGYFGTRIFEGVFLALGAVSLLLLPVIGGESLKSSGTDAAVFDTMGAVAIGGNFVAYNVAMAGLGFGSLFFCYLLLRSGLVPRFLAVWGFVGYASFLAGCLLELFGFAGAGLVSTIPGGLFELFFGIWLIVKGFNPSAVAGAPAKAVVAAA